MPINFAIKLAATVAMEALQIGLQASKRTSGPRLDELTVTVAEFGTPLPRFLGARKFACPVIPRRGSEGGRARPPRSRAAASRPPTIISRPSARDRRQPDRQGPEDLVRRQAGL
jgi:hypothetical protein